MMMHVMVPEAICEHCRAGHAVGSVCPICGYPEEPRRPLRAVIISILFCATGILGFAIVPLYLRWVGQKGKYSIVAFPLEFLLPPGFLAKLAVIALAIVGAIHLGIALGGNDLLGWVIAAFCFVDIPLRLVLVPIQLVQYLRTYY
jgi:hypothetical protein